jgi:hypothetical protein
MVRQKIRFSLMNNVKETKSTVTSYNWRIIIDWARENGKQSLIQPVASFSIGSRQKKKTLGKYWAYIHRAGEDCRHGHRQGCLRGNRIGNHNVFRLRRCEFILIGRGFIALWEWEWDNIFITVTLARRADRGAIEAKIAISAFLILLFTTAAGMTNSRAVLLIHFRHTFQGFSTGNTVTWHTPVSVGIRTRLVVAAWAKLRNADNGSISAHGLVTFSTETLLSSLRRPRTFKAEAI